MHCSNCGSTNNSEARFCRSCGKVFEDSQYYVWKSGTTEPLGPVTESDLKSKLAQRQLSMEDSIAKVGENSWTPISKTSFSSANNSSQNPSAIPVPAPVAAPSQQLMQQPLAMQVQQQPMQQQTYQPTQQSGNMSDVGKVMMYESNKKSAGIAYLMWFFLGIFGGHRFYLGESGTGAAILCITLGSFVLMFVFVGFLTIWISSIWCFVDLFLIPGLTEKHNNQLAMRLNIN